MNNLISFFIWDFPKEIFSFSLPLLHRPILWYGLFFATGFFFAFLRFRKNLNSLYSSMYSVDFAEAKNLSKKYADQLILYIFGGMLLGARLGDILFYQGWNGISSLTFLFKFWEGGLASHGGVIGILIGLLLFCKSKNFKEEALHIPLRSLLDAIAVSALIACGCIRLGNFFNQEILGIPTDISWAVLFLHPLDGNSELVPRHPVQLYEGAFYFLSFFFFQKLYKKWVKFPGITAGLLFIVIFTFRFFIEFLKEKQSALITGQNFLDMGQILSVPFILFGFYLMRRRKQDLKSSHLVKGD